jgi:hypothetical protein
MLHTVYANNNINNDNNYNYYSFPRTKAKKISRFSTLAITGEKFKIKQYAFRSEMDLCSEGSEGLDGYEF